MLDIVAILWGEINLDHAAQVIFLMISNESGQSGTDNLGSLGLSDPDLVLADCVFKIQNGRHKTQDMIS